MALNKEKSDLTFKMLDRWTSPDMRTARLVAWNFVQSRHLDADDQVIDLSEMKKADDLAFRAFTDVCQFVSDLQKLSVGPQRS